MDETPVAAPEPKALDLKTLQKVKEKGESKKVAARRGKKTTAKQKVPIFDIRAQAKGPIRPGPATYVVCPICTRLFGRPTGTRARHASRHLSDHRMGRIRRPVDPKEAKSE